MQNNLLTVTIIGRVNVGKSTLFNKLIEKRQAMMSSIPGTTRDLNYGQAEWQGVSFELVDTGGFIESINKKQLARNAENVDEQVRLKALKAINKANLILLVVDVKDGLNPLDKEIARFILKSKKQCLLVVNKCDSPRLRQETAEFFRLGLGEPNLISATTGSGTGDLLDEIIKIIKPESTKKAPTRKRKVDYKSDGEEKAEQKLDGKDHQDAIRVSIVGKPNAGKSSLINSLIGEDKFIVSATAHTTREPNDTTLKYENQTIILSDTAGIRRKAKIDSESLEKLGVMMSIGSLRSADIVLLMVDISEPLSDQDANLANLIVEAGAGVIIVANKYDLAKQSRSEVDEQSPFFKNPTKYLSDQIYHTMPHLVWAPIIFTSAKTGSNVQKILKLILEINSNRQQRIGANALDKFLKSIIKKQPPPKLRSEKRRAFITDFEQVGVNPPVFVGYTQNEAEPVPQSYRRYIEKNLREKFGFGGTPIKLVIKYKE